jgi:hypothetical protein
LILISTPGVSELAGERWPDVAEQAPTVYAVWGGGATPAQALVHSPADGSGITIRIRYRILNARLAAGAMGARNRRRGSGLRRMAGSVPV